ncbi:MAG: hypothetical protein IT245_06715 [Bacteroidia bacterium]|nr:hypothetical protein [Bacteroidia bacterium]
MALFKNTKVNIGTIKSGSSHTVTWDFEELKKADIGEYFENGKWEYAVFKNCSCQGEVLISEKQFTLEYKDKGLKDGEFTKEVKVYLKNGNMPIRVQNDRGIMVFNEQLGSITLYFTVNVV